MAGQWKNFKKHTKVEEDRQVNSSRGIADCDRIELETNALTSVDVSNISKPSRVIDDTRSLTHDSMLDDDFPPRIAKWG